MRSKQFQPVVNHAHHLEQEAAKALGDANRQVANAMEQLEQLQLYRREYIQRYQAMGEQGVDPSRLRDYQAFLSKLNDAMEQQIQAIEAAQQKQAEVRKFWIAKRGRSKALDSVLHRYIEEEMVAESKKEQREIDDRYRPPTSS